jgi:hypothetical protein
MPGLDAATAERLGKAIGSGKIVEKRRGAA